MRHMQITVAVPDDARWMTTDRNGRLSHWEGTEPVPSEAYREWVGVSGSVLLASVDTGIPCPTWRDSLVELKPENENE